MLAKAFSRTELVAPARPYDEYPRLRRGESRVSEELVAAYDPFGAPAEALRAVRGELLLRWLDQQPARRALAILSAQRKDGRSFVTANLAVAFAQIGVRTLIVDADLRSGRQHQLFGVDNAAGLSTVLAERATPHEVLQHPLPNLSLLPSGPLSVSPQDLFARPAFAQLLPQLAAHADLVLLDTPPFGLAADAQTIAVRAGAALIVVRRNSSRTWRVQGVSNAVLQAKCAIVGAVLNET
jgi:protein-tyrosine kinase